MTTWTRWLRAHPVAAERVHAAGGRVAFRREVVAEEQDAGRLRPVAARDGAVAGVAHRRAVQAAQRIDDAAVQLVDAAQQIAVVEAGADLVPDGQRAEALRAVDERQRDAQRAQRIGRDGRGFVAPMAHEQRLAPGIPGIDAQLAGVELEKLRRAGGAGPQVLEAARRGDHGLAFEEGAAAAPQARARR